MPECATKNFPALEGMAMRQFNIPIFATILASALLVSVPMAVGEIAQPQANAIEKFAQAIAGTRRCPKYTVNVRLMTMITLSLQINLDDADTKRLLDERVTYHTRRIAPRAAEDICASLARIYGPEGSDVAGLVVEVPRP